MGDADTLAGSQLAQIIDKQATMATDIAVILERTSVLADHETRLRALELARSKLGAFWAAAVVLGTVIGGAVTALITYLARR